MSTTKFSLEYLADKHPKIIKALELACHVVVVSFMLIFIANMFFYSIYNATILLLVPMFYFIGLICYGLNLINRYKENEQRKQEHTRLEVAAAIAADQSAGDQDPRHPVGL